MSPGYRVGGKTGTAEMPGQGGYQQEVGHLVVSSRAFPMDAPQYLTFVSAVRAAAHGRSQAAQITAGVNAAPATAAHVARIAPLLGRDAANGRRTRPPTRAI